jgi:hypothetical protein
MEHGGTLFFGRVYLVAQRGEDFETLELESPYDRFGARGSVSY